MTILNTDYAQMATILGDGDTATYITLLPVSHVSMPFQAIIAVPHKPGPKGNVIFIVHGEDLVCSQFITFTKYNALSCGQEGQCKHGNMCELIPDSSSTVLCIFLCFCVNMDRSGDMQHIKLFHLTTPNITMKINEIQVTSGLVLGMYDYSIHFYSKT